MRKAAIAVAVWLIAPACMATEYTFNLDNVTFNDGGTATGSFTLDLSTGTLSNVNIVTSTDMYSVPYGTLGTTYNDASSNTFTNGSSADFGFLNGSIFGFDSLDLQIAGPLTDITLSGSPSFALSGSEEDDAFFGCEGNSMGACGIRAINGGTLDVSGGIADTPLPATLPLFASGLGLLGYCSGRRRKASRTTA